MKSRKNSSWSSLNPISIWLKVGVLAAMLQISISIVTAQVQDRWFTPTGSITNNGLTSGTAKRFTNYEINLWLADKAGLTNLTIHFLPGDYLVGGTNLGHSGTSDSIYIQGGTNRIVRFVGETNGVGDRPRLFLGEVKTTNDWASGYPKNQWMFHQASSNQYYDYLGRIEVENLILDGNFKGLGAWTSAANAGGYRSYALELMAVTGRVRNVLIQNFGSVGKVPVSHLDNFGGVEAFPLWIQTFAEGQSPVGGDPTPWLIEDVEVKDFETSHQGYGSLLMPKCYMASPGALGDSTVILLRRCQVRGSPGAIASGTAGGKVLTAGTFTDHSTYTYSGRIEFRDNVVINAGSGFNTDTGSIGPLTYTNNAFLDIKVFGNLGWANSQSPAHNGYAFNDNAIRLSGRDLYKDYRDMCLFDPDTGETDPNLGLGRYGTNDCNGLVIQGVAGNIFLSGNDFTTRQLGTFFNPNPSNSSEAIYRIVWSIPSNQALDCTVWARPRYPVTNMVFGSNRLSQIAYDFGSFSNLGSGTYASFTTNSAPNYNNVRTAISTTPTVFTPIGRLERVSIVTNGSSRLTAVREVQLGQMTYSGANNGTLSVTSRVADHRLAAGGSTGTLAVSGQTLRLTNTIVLSDGSLRVGAWSGTSDGNGVVTFSALQQNLWVRMAHSNSRRASP